jgi:lipoyl(octanoyl) transferase
MNPEAELLDWGTVDYAEALARQRELFDELTAAKERTGWVVLCEHPHVYTLGRSGRAENLLVGEDSLRERGAALHRTERGGDITYHGPGQLVAYPILDLDRVGLGLRAYVEALESSVIETVAAFGITAGRAAGKTGVWVGGDNNRSTGGEPARAPRKICAIGVRASRGVVMHGLALNVATDLGWFDLINPCGMVGGAVTSIEKEVGGKVAMNGVKKLLKERLGENLKIII